MCHSNNQELHCLSINLYIMFLTFELSLFTDYAPVMRMWLLLCPEVSLMCSFLCSRSWDAECEDCWEAHVSSEVIRLYVSPWGELVCSGTVRIKTSNRPLCLWLWIIFGNYSCSMIYCSLEGGVSLHKPQCLGKNMRKEIKRSTEYNTSCVNMDKDLH